MSQTAEDRSLDEVRRLTARMLRALADGHDAAASELRQERQRRLDALAVECAVLRAA